MTMFLQLDENDGYFTLVDDARIDLKPVQSEKKKDPD
jgi:hypothetical protein